ncbi:MAG: Gfo/Idh/MocA family oxidoreductase [Kiritimatiellaeota bacterium]|nr:Gfo/Idh/MocA family oxidoreductase [Kiritimatiellota bacterium]
MNEVRIGVAGLGNMGNDHANRLLAGQVKNLRLTAVCDILPAKMERFKDPVKKFTDTRAMIRSGEIDAILIATPHYGHTTIGIDAFENNLHVCSEKPLAVHKKDAQRNIAAWQAAKKKNPGIVFSAMFQMRAVNYYKKVREVVQRGDLGEVTRVNWIITNWFRPHAYYASGGWRATWKGEGGGVLLNQCPHNLDLLQWITGMPSKMRAFCNLGKFHDIEVEDEVTAYFEYPNGATGVFITTTGEAPGTNRLEICGDLGRVVCENGKIAFTRNLTPMREFSKTTPHSFACPEVWNIDVPFNGWGGQHNEILQNFTNAILDGTPLIAPAEEGINAVELACGMLYSSFIGKTVDLPLDADAYERHLKKLIAGSKDKKDVREGGVVSLDGSSNIK